MPSTSPCLHTTELPLSLLEAAPIRFLLFFLYLTGIIIPAFGQQTIEKTVRLQADKPLATQFDGQYRPSVKVSTGRLDGQVEIRVEDNGPGIPEEIRSKVFEPFFTTKPTGQGTGLGLSLAYEIVTQGHGGTLSVESEAGKGAAFIMTLPYTRAGLTEEEQIRSVAGSTGQK